MNFNTDMEEWRSTEDEKIVFGGKSCSGGLIRNHCFNKCTLAYADLSYTEMHYTSFKNCLLNDTLFHFSRFYDVDIKDTIVRTDFYKCLFEIIDFSNTVFVKSVFDYSEFFKVNLKKTVLLGCDFSRAQFLDNVDFKGAKYTWNTKFPEGFNPEEKGMIRLEQFDFSMD